LTYTAGGEVVKRFSQKWNVLIPKLCWNWENEEIHHFVKEMIFLLWFFDEIIPFTTKKISQK
jgi:hypothetical protein